MVYHFNPLEDKRWSEFVAIHPNSSVFHTTMWLKALQETYGYKPLVITTTPPDGKLCNGLLFCHVESWLTGHRLVSLPFSDHCQPLVDHPHAMIDILRGTEERFHNGRLRYIELRPIQPLPGTTDSFREGQEYCLHQLDLRPSVDMIFSRFHKDSTQRKIRRAEREGLTIEKGRSDVLLDSFYRLQIITRRRHGLPPQPRKWFRSLIDTFGDALNILIASKRGVPVAAIVTIRFKKILMYKYGCSDIRFNNLGGTHLLFWKSIEEAKEIGLQCFDLGRSDVDQTGLITFKDRWGAKCSRLTYLRCPPNSVNSSERNWGTQFAMGAFSRAPNAVLSALGGRLYRHVG